MDMMLDKKLIQVIFLSSKLVIKQQRHLSKSTNSLFGPGTANKCTGQWWFKKFYKEGENLEDEEYSGQLSEADNDS